MNKQQILDLLNYDKIVHFQFKKADGSIRDAVGTMDWAFILNYWEPTGTGSEEHTEVIRYFDVEALSWRSFRVENFIGVTG